jgi:hypothetical protein
LRVMLEFQSTFSHQVQLKSLLAKWLFNFNSLLISSISILSLNESSSIYLDFNISNKCLNV